uniref:Uncharacterized protein n=1 Tax=Pipistrellus kuhlii TaxID=59472 RepID=A0A7J7ZJ61_PIPKU|nr:hypothetical protein mPipKuh1_009388 [Pipistrellus kuhlii]
MWLRWLMSLPTTGLGLPEWKLVKVDSWDRGHRPGAKARSRQPPAPARSFPDTLERAPTAGGALLSSYRPLLRSSQQSHRTACTSLTQVTTRSLRRMKGPAPLGTAVQRCWAVGYESRLCGTKTHALGHRPCRCLYRQPAASILGDHGDQAFPRPSWQELGGRGHRSAGEMGGGPWGSYRGSCLIGVPAFAPHRHAPSRSPSFLQLTSR